MILQLTLSVLVALGIHLADGVLMEFKFLDQDKFLRDAENFRMITDQTLNMCYDACYYRPRCQSFNWYRSMGICWLYEHGSNNKYPLEMRAGFVFSQKKDWKKKNPSTDECDCKWNQACNPKRKRKCEIKECGPYRNLTDRMTLLGNQYAVGNKLLLKCKPGFKSVGKKVSLKCLKNGMWENTDLQCLQYVLGDACRNTEDCSDRVANSVCDTTCKCGTGFKEDSLGGCTSNAVGDTCKTDMDCRTVSVNAHCDCRGCVIGDFLMKSETACCNSAGKPCTEVNLTCPPATKMVLGRVVSECRKKDSSICTIQENDNINQHCCKNNKDDDCTKLQSINKRWQLFKHCFGQQPCTFAWEQFNNAFQYISVPYRCAPEIKIPERNSSFESVIGENRKTSWSCSSDQRNAKCLYNKMYCDVGFWFNSVDGTCQKAHLCGFKPQTHKCESWTVLAEVSAFNFEPVAIQKYKVGSTMMNRLNEGSVDGCFDKKGTYNSLSITVPKQTCVGLIVIDMGETIDSSASEDLLVFVGNDVCYMSKDKPFTNVVDIDCRLTRPASFVIVWRPDNLRICSVQIYTITTA